MLFKLFGAKKKDNDAPARPQIQHKPAPQPSAPIPEAKPAAPVAAPVIHEEVKAPMTEKKYVAAIDQGTTSTRCMLFTKDGRPAAWVEHNAMEIWSRTQDVIRGALAAVNATPEEIAAVGITNQRETTVVWEKATGKPIYNAIVWQCTRTQDFCAEWLKKPGWGQNEKGEGKVKDITGLLINPYFSGTKIRWILDNVPGAREKAEKGELLFGNTDTYRTHHVPC